MAPVGRCGREGVDEGSGENEQEDRTREAAMPVEHVEMRVHVQPGRTLRFTTAPVGDAVAFRIHRRHFYLPLIVSIVQAVRHVVSASNHRLRCLT